MKKNNLIKICLCMCLLVIIPITFSGCQITSFDLIKNEATSLFNKIKEIDFSKFIKIFKK